MVWVVSLLRGEGDGDIHYIQRWLAGAIPMLINWEKMYEIFFSAVQYFKIIYTPRCQYQCLEQECRAHYQLWTIFHSLIQVPFRVWLDHSSLCYMYVVLLTNVEEAGYSSLTAVQCQTIPAALHGRDLLVQATTGSIIFNTHTNTHTHCILSSGSISMVPHEDSQTFVNGRLITEPEELRTGSRIILGNNHVFRFTNPEQG